MKEVKLLEVVLVCVVAVVLSGSRVVEGYKNYTVGDSLGWYDQTEKPNLNYQKWADSKNFSLGDFLCMFLFFSLIHTYVVN